MITNLKNVRLQQNRTQSEVAEYLNISRAAYTNIENGKRDPDTETIVKLREFFHVTIDLLFGFVDSTVDIQKPDPYIVTLYNGLNTRGKKQAIENLESMNRDPELKEGLTQKTSIS